MFIDSSDKVVVVVGAGKIAERRIKTLLMFSFKVKVIAPHISPGISHLAEDERISICRRDFASDDIEGAAFVLSCTDDREVNKCVGELCRMKGLYVSVCDSAEESTMWFPAVAINECLNIGIVGEGSSHTETKNTAARIRKMLEEEDY